MVSVATIMRQKLCPGRAIDIRQSLNLRQLFPKTVLYFGFELEKSESAFLLSNDDYVDIMCAIAIKAYNVKCILH